MSPTGQEEDEEDIGVLWLIRIRLGVYLMMTAKNTKTPAMVLQEFSVKNKISPPTYEIISSVTGTHENRFDYRVTIAGVVAEGTGTSKQIGKHNAAHNALLMLEEIGKYNAEENPVKEFKASASKPNNTAPESPFKASPNCIGPLKDMCAEYKIPDPIFTLISDVGPPHSREFTYQCSVASIKTVATGNTKKMAKQIAAKDMLERIKDVVPTIAEQCNKDEGQKAISYTNMQVLQMYNEFFGTIVPDKTVEIGDYSHTLTKLMVANEVTFANFSKEFQERTEEALKRILDKLGLAHNIYEMQNDPPIVALSLNTDTPFTTLGMSNSTESSKAEALSQAFEIMQVLMQL